MLVAETDNNLFSVADIYYLLRESFNMMHLISSGNWKKGMTSSQLLIA